MVTGVEGNVVGTDNNEDRIKWTASKCTVQPGHPFVECGSSSSSSSIGAHALHHFEVPCLCIADDDVAVEFQCTDGAPSCDFTLDQALVYVWVPERWDASSAGAPIFIYQESALQLFLFILGICTVVEMSMTLSNNWTPTVFFLQIVGKVRYCLPIHLFLVCRVLSQKLFNENMGH